MNRRLGIGARTGVGVLLLFCCGPLRAEEASKDGSSGRADAPAASVEVAPPARPGDAARAATPAARPAGRSGPRPPVIREPSQGRPIFRTPGETFYFVMKLPSEVKGSVEISLHHALEPGVAFPLRAKTPMSHVGAYSHLLLEIGEEVPPSLYDLAVKTDSTTYYSRRSVKVVDGYKDRFRFVHLSNMNIGDLTAPDFDEMLPREINLLAPEFIVATGDYTEWARALDDASSWVRVLKYFEKFNAPVYMVCGSHDHGASFTEFVASKPMDVIDYGNYHGLLLLDHAANPIDQDFAQIEWVDRDLKKNRRKRMNFIVGNSDELGLIDVWRERGNIEEFVRAHKIGLYIAGGSTDWDYREFAEKLKGLDDLQFVRTHESSTCMRDRATGFSHYRVIEIDGDKVSYTYAQETNREDLQYSIPSGRLRAYFDAPNDGTSPRVVATIQNALNQAFDRAEIWLRVAKKPGVTKPTVAPGRVIRVLDAGDHWACQVGYDLPDKGAVRIMAAADPSVVPPKMPIRVTLAGDRLWRFAPKTTSFGLTYYESDATARISLTNASKSARTCWPVVRVNGAKLHLDRARAPRLPLTLQPGETLDVPLVVSLRRVSPGSHKLQVYFLEDRLSRLTTFDVDLALSEAPSGSTETT
ncbi:MAG: metallophosphoesterase family protein, partial [Phycisphaerae bacterium]